MKDFDKLYEELSILNEAIFDCPHCGKKLKIDIDAAYDDGVVIRKPATHKRDVFRLTWNDDYISAAGAETTDAVGYPGIMEAIKNVCGVELTADTVKNWTRLAGPSNQSWKRFLKVPPENLTDYTNRAHRNY